MSSSADGAPTWSEFGARAATDVELQSPAVEFAEVLRRYRAGLDAADRAVCAARADGMRALAEQSVLVVRLETLLDRYATPLADPTLTEVHRALRIVKDRMLEQIGASGLDIVRLAGAGAHEVIEIAEVEHWLHDDQFVSEVVAEEIEPAVLLGGSPLRLGRVVMGAPPAGMAHEPDADGDSRATSGQAPGAAATSDDTPPDGST